MNADCSDIRFTDADGTTEISYWLESGCDTANTKIWVNVPSIPTGGTTVYMYYGNPSASSASNGNNTFEFFDDFEGTTLDTDKWALDVTTNSAITGTVSGGKYRVTGGYASSNNWWIYTTQGTYGNQHHAKNLPSIDNIIVEWKSTTENTGDMSQVGLALTDAPPTGINRAYLHHSDDQGGNGIVPARSWLYETTLASESASVPETKNFKMARYGTTVKFYIDDVLKATGTLVVNPTNLSITVGTYEVYVFMPVTLDTVLVRKYASPEPSATIGTEEAK